MVSARLLSVHSKLLAAKVSLPHLCNSRGCFPTAHHRTVSVSPHHSIFQLTQYLPECRCAKGFSPCLLSAHDVSMPPDLPLLPPASPGTFFFPGMHQIPFVVTKSHPILHPLQHITCLKLGTCTF